MLRSGALVSLVAAVASDPWTRSGEEEEYPKVARFRGMPAIRPQLIHQDMFGEGVPRVGHSYDQQLPGHPQLGAFAFLTSVKWLKGKSQVEGVKNSRLWIWLNFTLFLFALFRSPVLQQTFLSFCLSDGESADARPKMLQLSIFNIVCQ